ncbi:hypothetical protein SKAU_G00345640 [Synaphobranchus kaupii]|uniref:Uncharacterized protein n=1 Tax=Synaphobranchus kaupii TaxID=118154 RepID=A0A9Q1IHN6_SYNKA|nr:hypothetical protein SKAU_G00345640 [Synaphobranchus kaupii]
MMMNPYALNTPGSLVTAAQCPETHPHLLPTAVGSLRSFQRHCPWLAGKASTSPAPGVFRQTARYHGDRGYAFGLFASEPQVVDEVAVPSVPTGEDKAQLLRAGVGQMPLTCHVFQAGGKRGAGFGSGSLAKTSSSGANSAACSGAVMISTPSLQERGLLSPFPSLPSTYAVFSPTPSPGEVPPAAAVLRDGGGSVRRRWLASRGAERAPKAAGEPGRAASTCLSPHGSRSRFCRKLPPCLTLPVRTDGKKRAADVRCEQPCLFRFLLKTEGVCERFSSVVE